MHSVRTLYHGATVAVIWQKGIGLSMENDHRTALSDLTCLSIHVHLIIGLISVDSAHSTVKVYVFAPALLPTKINIHMCCERTILCSLSHDCWNRVLCTTLCLCYRFFPAFGKLSSQPVQVFKSSLLLNFGKLLKFSGALSLSVIR